MPDKEKMEYNPLVYQWVAFYENGRVLPQFNPYTGEEHDWCDIDQDSLVKFGLYPFNAELALILFNRGVTVHPKNIEAHEVFLDKGMRLIFVRRQFIKKFTFHSCNRCENKWIAKEGDEWELIAKTVQNGKEHSYTSYKCPKCEAYNVMVCPGCGLIVNKVKGKEKGTFEYECPRCLHDGKPTRHPRYISRHGASTRYTKYLLGYQETTNGRNSKFMITIDDNGNVKLNDEDIDN
jgi:hypothetical protein